MKNTQPLDLISLKPLLLALLCVLIGLLAVYSLRVRFDHDEFEATHTAWKILQGEEIYVDFFQHHHSLFYYSLIPTIAAFGSSVSTVLLLRVQMYLLFLGTLFLCYCVAKAVLKTSAEALLSVVFLCSTVVFLSKAIEIRPDLLQTALGLGAVAFHIRHSKTRARLDLVGGALCLGLSFLLLQKAVFLMAGLFVIQGFQVRKKELSLFECVLFWAVVALSILPYAMVLWLTGTLDSYWTFNWLLNMKFNDAMTPWQGILKTLLENIALWVFFGLGLRRASGWTRRLGWLALWLIAALFLVRVPYRQYFVVFIPFAAVVAAAAFSRLVRSPRQAVWILTLSCLVPAVDLTHDILFKSNTKQLARIQYVLEHTDPDDLVYDGNAMFNLFRHDVDFFWFSVRPERSGLATYQSIRSYDYDIYQIIEAKRPKVIATNYIPDLDHPVIRASYRRSAEFDQLYLRQ